MSAAQAKPWAAAEAAERLHGIGSLFSFFFRPINTDSLPHTEPDGLEARIPSVPPLQGSPLVGDDSQGLRPGLSHQSWNSPPKEHDRMKCADVDLYQ